MTKLKNQLIDVTKPMPKGHSMLVWPSNGVY